MSAGVFIQGSSSSELIPLLQEIQSKLKHIPAEAVSFLADKLRISEQEIYGVATFYNNFRFIPPGKHELKICMGTACYVRGGENLLTSVRERLGIDPGETTPDRNYSLERVACMGCCALAPVVVLDGEVQGKINQRLFSRLLTNVEKQDREKQENTRLVEAGAEAEVAE